MYQKNINSNEININLIQIDEEKTLFQEIKSFNKDEKKLFTEQKYKIILSRLKNFENPINNFFKKVQINHYNPEIKKNRLVLLKQVEKIFFKIANFSYLY